ncbi:MAG: hypothetical protein AAF320_03930, partial [Myxococcota bacterium]
MKERSLLPDKKTMTLTTNKASVGLSFGQTPASRRAMEIVQSAYKIRLPHSWSKIPRLSELVSEEMKRIQKKFGKDAFVNLREHTGNPLDRGQLLKRRNKAGGGEYTQLTSEAERALKRKKGLARGYIGYDRAGNEQLVKIFEVGQKGMLEIGLSWQGMAGPLVEEWRDRFQEQVEQISFEFESLDEEQKRKINRMLERNRLWNHGSRVMECILGQVGRQRCNPVEIPAEAFRVLLWPTRAKDRNWPQNWKHEVESTLSVLRSMSFTVKTYQMQTLQGEGAFIGEWHYIGRGQGDHGDGIYIIDVQEGFLGCLSVFASGKTKLRSGKEIIQLDFNKRIDNIQREQLGWNVQGQAQDAFVCFDAGRVFYNTAANLTPRQENVLAWIEQNLTLNRDAARKKLASSRQSTKKNSESGAQRRLYNSAFCPLLPANMNFFGALGHFRKNPETGFTLYGTKDNFSTHPQASGGLIASIDCGATIKNPSTAKRQKIVTQFLHDLKTVVVDHLNGVVVGKLGSQWIALNCFQNLDENTLCRKLLILCFVPNTYEERRRKQWEETTNRRVVENARKSEEGWHATGTPNQE